MRRVLVIGLLALIAAVMGGVALLAGTQWGLERAFSLVRAALPGELRVRKLSGRVLGPVVVEGLEYVHDGSSFALARGRLDWAPRSLLGWELRVTELALDDLGIELTPAAGPQDSARALPALRLPLPVRLETSRLAKLRLRTDPAGSLLVIDEVALAGSATADALSIERLEVTAYQAQLETGGTLRLAGRYPLKLRTRWRYAGAGTTPLQGEGDIEGDLARLRVVQRLDGAATAHIDAELTDLLAALRWHARVRLERFEARRVRADWPEVSAAGTIEAQGDLAQLAFAGQLSGRVPAIGDLRAEVDAAYKEGALDIARLALEQAPSGTRVEASGRWRAGPGVGELALDGSWRGLTWPPLPPAAARSWVSPHGRFSVDGTPDEYRLRVQAKVSAAGVPESVIEAHGTGSTQALALGQLRIATLGGTVNGAAQLAWMPVLEAKATLDFSDIDPGRHWPDWPGRLNGSVAGEVSLAGKAPVARLELARLGGTLHTASVEGSGRLFLERDTLRAERLALALNDARVRLEGSVGERWDLKWQLEATDLASAWPGAGGEISARGTLDGPRLAPHVVASLAGRGLAWQGDRVAELAAEVDLDLQAERRFHLALRAENIDARGTRWGRVQLAGEGSAREHRLELDAEGGEGSLGVRLSGALDEAPLAWAGKISLVELRLPKLGEWRLEQASAVRLTRASAHVEPLCLAQAQARICAGADWKAGTAVVTADGRALPLERLSPWLPADTKVAGQAHVQARLAWGARGIDEGRVVLTADDVALSHPEVDEPLRFGTIEAGASIDAKGAKAALAMPLAAGGGLEASVALPGWRAAEAPAGDQPVAGELHVRDLPLELIARVTPTLVAVRGIVRAQVGIAGTFADPRVTGSARLEDASADLPLLGLRLREIRGELASDEGSRLRYDFSARSGEGALSARGQTELRPEAGWPTQVAIRGERVQVVNLPEALVEVTPSINVTVAGRDVGIEGEVAVPRARLRPRKLPEGTVSASSDVVVVGQSAPVEDERWKVRARLRATLGERVDFDGFGVRGRLVGNLLLIDEPGRLTAGQGEVRIVDGVYQMRGQDLSIRRGRLIYADTLVDDPGVDAEAVRVIGEVTAGVRVRGTLKRPELTVFSEPAMTESDALSYILIGRPLRDASAAEGERMQQAALAAGVLGGDLIAREVGDRLGLDEIRVEAGETAQQTALVMGKYLTPKLYVRYLTGIVESSNIVQLRYDLTRRVQIQTEGGYRGYQNVSGGDIFYTFEH